LVTSNFLKASNFPRVGHDGLSKGIIFYSLGELGHCTTEDGGALRFTIYVVGASEGDVRVEYHMKLIVFEKAAVASTFSSAFAAGAANNVDVVELEDLDGSPLLSARN